MIAVSKEEKEIILKNFPNAHIVRTMKTSSKRHRYYCEETKRVIALLEQLRGEETEDSGA